MRDDEEQLGLQQHDIDTLKKVESELSGELKSLRDAFNDLRYQNDENIRTINQKEDEIANHNIEIEALKKLTEAGGEKEREL